jgi:hypothetical protein
MGEDEVIDEGAARSVILQDDQTRRGGGFALAQNEHTADDDEGGAAAVDVSWGCCRDSVAVDEVPANEDEFGHSSQQRWTLGSSNKFTLEGVLVQTEPGSVPERAPYSVDVCGLEESEKVVRTCSRSRALIISWAHASLCVRSWYVHVTPPARAHISLPMICRESTR